MIYVEGWLNSKFDYLEKELNAALLDASSFLNQMNDELEYSIQNPDFSTWW